MTILNFNRVVPGGSRFLKQVYQEKAIHKIRTPKSHLQDLKKKIKNIF